jgi:putative oxidoreductase
MVSIDTLVQYSAFEGSGLMATVIHRVVGPALLIMDASLFTLGAQATDAGLTLNRVALGTFFAISGYHKLFSAARHATLIQTLRDDGVRPVAIMQWLVPGVEFSAGFALIIGLLSALAAFGLFVVCLGAFALDAIKRVRDWRPIDRADWFGDLLYLPEALYCIGLVVVMLAGPGAWSVDHFIAALLAT